VSNLIPYGAASSRIETRYPFLARPLVELALATDPQILASPTETKPLLRAAMRGILPEQVRMRKTKGSATARLIWSLTKERERIEEMLRDPLLAQLGCVEPTTFRRAYEDARVGKVSTLQYIYSALSLETWLTVQNGRWDGRVRSNGNPLTNASIQN
jgi:asparagine synthase (glutamine-hydrolysing)